MPSRWNRTTEVEAIPPAPILAAVFLLCLAFALIAAFTPLASATPCLIDADCNATSYCDYDVTFMCQARLADGLACTRDRMCANYCVINVCGMPAIDLTGFSVPPSTNLSAALDLTSVQMVLDAPYGQVNWTLPLDLSDGANFTGGCRINDTWIWCDPAILPGIAGKMARVWLKQTPWPLRNLNGIVFVKDGLACGSSCTAKAKVAENILWNASGFSNYSLQSSSNYSAVIINMTVPPVCRLDGSCTVYFVLANTLGALLDGEDADIYVTDVNGTLMTRFPTLQYYPNNTFLDENGNWVSDVPVTNKLGEYLYEYPLDRAWAQAGGNYTVHAVANNEHATASVYVDVPWQGSVDWRLEYLRRYSGVVLAVGLAAAVAVGILAAAAAVAYFGLRKRRRRSH